jgi:pullulanase/glycogen debranching enzyme
MSDHQPTNQAPQIESDLTAENITMKIDKAPKQSAEFLDDHLGKSLADSIAKLIGQSNSEQKKKPRKKKVLTEAQREQCKKNLAKGRETIKRKKEEAQKANETRAQAPTPTLRPLPVENC